MGHFSNGKLLLKLESFKMFAISNVQFKFSSRGSIQLTKQRASVSLPLLLDSMVNSLSQIKNLTFRKDGLESFLYLISDF